ncbi:myb-like transcription factor family protein [Striga hermonthica]|uniref:Myb-like transcription factor family protein n=1 Tax=Striga hermonthica TaxID=68872 RepID=A0A9N7NDM5_STRHE|nr:myb-like transcription factor family protein [Striga hermonthica]
MTRRSHCNANGHHNTPTCGGGGGGLRLFGVRLTDGSFIKKSASMGNLSHSSAAPEPAGGYHSDDPDRGGATAALRLPPIRKRGIPWTEEEHRQFLLGLQQLGKGNWRGISKGYVRSRTPTQETSPTSNTRQLSIPSPQAVTANESEKLMLTSSSSSSSSQGAISSLDLSLKPAFTSLDHSLEDNKARKSQHHQIITNVPAVQEPMKELLGMSQLTLGETGILQNEALTFSLSVAENP